MTNFSAAALNTTIPEICMTHMQSLHNPFYTPEYITYRCSQGDTPWILSSNSAHTQSEIHCLAFMKSGRLRHSLEIPSVPDISRDEPFWHGLVNFCRNKGISNLSINSFGAQGGLIPQLAHERSRKKRYEYILDLTHSDALKEMSKQHVRKVKQAQKAGVKMQRACHQEAVEAHVRLISLSMQRRKSRGEKNITTSVPVKNIQHLVSTGTGEVFQAVLADQVISSNLILRAPRAGYNHSGGTSPEGMNCGASHFLIYEIAGALRDEGKKTFNLGGVDDPDPKSGLVRFKTGFGTERIQLEAAQFMPRSVASGFLQHFLSSIRK